MLISELKRHVARKLHIPVEQQKLLLLGRTLLDDHTIQMYPNIKEGTKLNLVVKKPESLYDASFKHYKRQGMSDKDAANTANKLLRIVQEKFDKMSWDEVDRLCYDCLLDERGIRRPAYIENDIEIDDMFNL